MNTLSLLNEINNKHELYKLFAMSRPVQVHGTANAGDKTKVLDATT